MKALHLVHHDPDHTDAVIDAKLAACRARLAARGASTIAVAPADGGAYEV